MPVPDDDKEKSRPALGARSKALVSPPRRAAADMERLETNIEKSEKEREFLVVAGSAATEAAPATVLQPQPPHPQQVPQPDIAAAASLLPDIGSQKTQEEPAKTTAPVQQTVPPAPLLQAASADTKPSPEILHFLELLQDSAKAAAKIDTEGMQIAKGIVDRGRDWAANRNCCDTSSWGLPERHFICLCTSVFKRTAAWKQAFPLHLVVALMSVPKVKLFVVTFGDDEEIQAWVQTNFRWAFHAGILHVASGGIAGMKWQPPVAAASTSASASSSSASSSSLNPFKLLAAPQKTTLYQRPSQPDVAVPLCIHWHATVGKNSSHQFAIEVMQQLGANTDEYLLLNVDADNVFSLQFVESTAKAWALEKKLVGDAPAVPGKQRTLTYPIRGIVGTSTVAGCTGRVCIQASDFVRLGGYDQESGVVGSGFQDVDLSRRLRQAVKNHANSTGVLPLRAASQSTVTLPCSAGTAFLNEPGITSREDRGWAKIKNCDPDDLARLKTWGKFNASNHTLMSAKLQSGQLGRNGMPHAVDFNASHEANCARFMKLQLGYWFAKAKIPARAPQAAAPLIQPLAAEPKAAAAAVSRAAASVPVVSACGATTADAGKGGPKATAAVRFDEAIVFILFDELFLFAIAAM